MENPTAVPGDEFLEELEGLRRQHLKGGLLRPRRHYNSKEEIAAARRKYHLGGDNNHRFEGERYLNCTDKAVRRQQLRKLIDEGGETTVGGKMPSHPILARWESHEVGLTDNDINELEISDANPETLIVWGWRVNLHRTGHWAVAIGSSLVGEGEKRIPGIRERLLSDIEAMKENYAALGVKNVERALAFHIEHADVDIDHAEFGADVVRKHVNTPQLQEQMRKAFVLTLHMKGF
ncbi:MAG TPA: hypothetical protein VGB25_09940 [Candidatus Binatia bacterium]